MKTVIISAIVTAVFFLLLPVRVCAEDAPGYTYTVINGEATVVGFTGEPESIVIPAEIEGCPVTEIRDNAFYNCKTLRYIELPQSVTKMGHHCFYECTALETAVLPSSLKEIGMGCFYGCSELSEVTIPTGLKILPDSCFRDCTSLTEVFIPANIRIIEKYCFSGCTSLTDAVMSENLEEIGGRAFYMCDSLNSLYIPPTVKWIGTEAAGFVQTGEKTEKASGFTILGGENSASYQYAAENGFNFRKASGSVQAMAVQEPAKESDRIPTRLIIGGIALFVMICASTVGQLMRPDRSRKRRRK